MLAFDPSSPCNAVITVLACVAFCTVASCAFAAWVTTPISTRAKSGLAETLAVPTAVMDAGPLAICAQEAVVNKNIAIGLRIFMKHSFLKGTGNHGRRLKTLQPMYIYPCLIIAQVS